MFYITRLGAIQRDPDRKKLQQRTKYEFVVNLKVAKLIGVAGPPTLLAIADEVIEFRGFA